MQAWENHLLRNQSLIVDLFHGQLRSQVRCKECGKVSVRFDPYSYLSLPLPMDSCIHLEILGKLLPVFDPTSDSTHTPHTHTHLHHSPPPHIHTPMDSCIHLEILGKLLPVFDPTSNSTPPHPTTPPHTPTPLPTPTHTHTHGLLYTLRNPG